MSDVKKNILIAGGSGLIGHRLTDLLLNEGYNVAWLSRNGGTYEGIKCFEWHPEAKSIDENALDGISHIINLAGTSISKPWTEKNKKEILQSRLDASETLLKALKNFPNKVTAVIAASAIGFYGNRSNEILTEESKEGKSFLSDTVLKWEASYNDCPVRVVKIRTGIVLSRDGGALPPMAKPLYFGMATVFGKGKQMMSWIHIDDLCRIYIHALNNQTIQGVYNAVSPSPLDQKSFIKILRKQVNRFSIIVPAPEFALNVILGEQKSLLLDSDNVSCNKIANTGFEFKFNILTSALKDLYGK